MNRMSDAPPRAFTVRAVVLGLALALPIAWLTPWNDWFLRNAFLYNNYLPAIVTGVLLMLALVVNPLLGARRLQRGELTVVTALLLVIGGVVSSGFIRYWPIAVAGPRATCWATFWRLTRSLWRSVSTMAPIMATSRTRPAAWK